MSERSDEHGGARTLAGAQPGQSGHSTRTINTIAPAVMPEADVSEVKA